MASNLTGIHGLLNSSVYVVDSSTGTETECGLLEGDLTDSLWRTIACNKLTGVQGTAVKIQSPGGTQLTFCGVKVYGYQSDVD